MSAKGAAAVPPPLILKVSIVEMNSVKAIQFSPSITVDMACMDIKERIGDTSDTMDFGLFYPQLGKWLQANRILDYYELPSGTLLEYKRKHRPLRVRMMDESIKTVLIDDSMVVVELVDLVCKRIGLSNPEEYSFQTLDTTSSEDAKKNTKKTETPSLVDDGKWLHPQKTLSEQGIHPADILLLKKKYFYSDKSIDRNDPIQLNLVYVQSRDAILNGNHPCTLDEATQLAALQCQVQFGNHEPDKHKPGFIKLKDFAPPDYQKDKSFEKKVYAEHRKLQGMNELNAKFRYVQLCRSLRTYGVTFFLVKEKLDKKNKLVPRLLGITRDRILRLDPETKEILSTWPLTTLRRWAPSPNSFTLDFGDYAEQYYSVQTTEGTAISQLIGGYIDIILKKRKEASQAEEAASIKEDVMKPARAMAVNVSSARSGKATENFVAVAGNVVDVGSRVKAQQVLSRRHIAKVSEVAELEYNAKPEHQAALQSIYNGCAAVQTYQSELSSPTSLPPLGNDPASLKWKTQTTSINKQTVSSHIAANLASVAAILNLVAATDLDTVDLEAVTTNLNAITTNLSQISSSSKMIAALSGPKEGETILATASEAAGCSSAFFKAVGIVLGAQEFTADMRDSLFTTAQKSTNISQALLKQIEELEVSDAAQASLIAIAQTVHKSADSLVAEGLSSLAEECSADPYLKPVIKSSQDIARQLGNVAAVVTACTFVVAPCVHTSVCQDQVMHGALVLNDHLVALGAVVEPIRGQLGGDSGGVATLNRYTAHLSSAIAQLVEKLKNPLQIGNNVASTGKNPEQELLRLYEETLNAASSMITLIQSGGGSSANLVESTKALAVSSSLLNQGVKGKAEAETDKSFRAALESIGKRLSDATTLLVVNAKEVARHPSNESKQAELIRAIQAIQQIALDGAGDQLRTRAFQKVVNHAKVYANSCTQLITASKTAASSNRDQQSQIALNQAAKSNIEVLSALVGSCRTFSKNPEQVEEQQKLLAAANQAISPGMSFVQAAKTASSSVYDETAQTQLVQLARKNQELLQELGTACLQAGATSAGLEFKSALRVLDGVAELCSKAQNSATSKTLKAELSAEVAQGQVLAAHPLLVANLNSITSAKNMQAFDITAQETALAFKNWTNAVIALAATATDVKYQQKLLSDVDQQAKLTFELMRTGKTSMAARQSGSPDADAKQEEVLKVSQRTISSVNATVDSLPGRREVERAIKTITASKDLLVSLDAAKGVKPGETYQSAQNRLNLAVASLSVACVALASASKAGNTDEIKASAAQYEDAYQGMMQAAQVMVAQSPDPKSREEIVNHVRKVMEDGLLLLESSKITPKDTEGSVGRTQLNTAAKQMADSIGKLLEKCTKSGPGLVECNEAEQLLLSASNKLEMANDPSMSDRPETYFDCISTSAEVSRQASASISAIATSIRSNDSGQAGKMARDLAKAAQTLADVSAVAAYLIAASDPNSAASTASKIDTSLFTASAEEIKNACAKLSERNTNQAQVLGIATIVAKQTSILCAKCKEFAESPKFSENTRQQFMNHAKTVAALTASLISQIKKLAPKLDESTRKECIDAAKALGECVNALVAFVGGPEFASSPASLSPVALQKQKQVLSASRGILDASQTLVRSAKLLCTGSSASTAQQSMVAGIKVATESFRDLASQLQQHAPGQESCDRAIEVVTRCGGDVDAAILQASMGALTLESEQTKLAVGAEQGLKDSLGDKIKAIQSLVPLLEAAATGKGISLDKTSASQFGALVEQLASHMESTTSTAVTLAKMMVESNAQKSMVEGIKSINDGCLAFVYGCKASAGNPNGQHAQTQSTSETLQKSLAQMVITLEGSIRDTAAFNASSDTIQEFLNQIHDTTRSIEELHENIPEANKNYQIYARKILGAGKRLADVAGEAIGNTNKPTSAYLTETNQKVEALFAELFDASRKAAHLSTTVEMKTALIDNTRDLGTASLKLVQAMKWANVAVASEQTSLDAAQRQKLSNAIREVSAAVTHLVTTAKEGSTGIQACELGMQQLADLAADLDTQIIFAQAGQLDPVDAKEFIGMYTDALRTDCETTLMLSRSVVDFAVAAKQEELAKAVGSCVQNTVDFKSDVNKSAMAVTSGDKAMQETLLTGAKNTIATLSQLLQLSMEVSGKPNAKESAEAKQLEEAYQQLEKKVNEFLTTVKQVGDESVRGRRALEAAAAEIQAATVELTSDAAAVGTAVPEEVITIAKSLATATAQLVSVSTRTVTPNFQNDLIAATSDLKKFVLDLLRMGKAATENAPEEQRSNMHSAVRRTAEAASCMLDRVKQGLATGGPNFKPAVQKEAKEVANAVNVVVEAAESLVPGGYVDPNDPNVIAERELLAAASSIEAAARKLAALKPPERPREANEDLNFEEQILEAAKAIAAATGALVRSATNAQREIISNEKKSAAAAGGKLPPGAGKEVYFSDGMWSDGLVSAAKMVAGATGDLCDAANAAVKGEVRREHVVAAARGVSSSTVQLLTAASVKADPSSQAQIRLRAAGKSVTQATEQLVKAAEESMALEETESVATLMKQVNTSSFAKQRAFELEAQAKVLQMEKELELARSRLTGLRKGKYNAK